MCQRCKMTEPVIAGKPPVFPAKARLLFAAAPECWDLALLFRFAMVGVVNTAFGYAVFAAAIFAGMPALAALAVATCAGIIFNFQTARRLVFRYKGGGRWLRFAVTYLALLLLNFVALKLLVRLGLPQLLAQAILALPIATISFLAQRTFMAAPAPALAKR
jgi:putative flippase GtrA